MTVRQYIRKYGWQIECEPNACRAMSVDIGFMDPDGRDDETQFDIAAYDERELSGLFDGFCKENHFRRNTVIGITIVQTADTMEDLS